MNAAPAKLNPFPGLRAFTPEEDYLFFGREEQTIELLQRLGSNRFVAVVGSSGSGKSSLVRCGLLSQLMGGKMLGAGAAWEVAVTHPGGNPLALLTDALLDADLYDRKEEHARENLLATLSRSHFGLVEAFKQANLSEGTNFLLVVDQFEEIFRFHEAGQMQQEAANEFVSLLLEAAAQKEVSIYIVLTMRSDFIGECGQFESLAEMVNQGEFLIPRLNRDQYKRVIEGPIKVAGGQIAPRLLQRLLNDLGQQADQLPCLQHALMRTWDVWASKAKSSPLSPVLGGEGPGVRGKASLAPSPPTPLPLSTEGEGRLTGPLDLDDYQRVGKMSQALSLHADEIYESLANDRQRELCKGMFQALTVEEANSRGIRRPQRVGRLCQILEVTVDELLPIINVYRRSGVTFLMPSPEVELTDQTIIDISHESLMRVWTRLRQWVEEETQAAGIYHRLSESADLHDQGKAGLYRDPELGIALAWRESKRPNAAWAERYRSGFATAMRFLEKSQQASVAEEQTREAARQRELVQAQQLAEAQELRLAQQQRAARKLRMMIWGLAVVAIAAVAAFVAALVANNNAKELAGLASLREAEANRQRKLAVGAAEDTKKALTQVETSLTKAEEAGKVARAAEEAGRKLLYSTDMRLAPFVWRDDRTTAEQLRVLLAKHIPDREAAKDKSDLRGFEWHYYQHQLESSAEVFVGHPVSVTDGAFAANGQLATLDQNAQVRRWNVDSRNEDTASRRDLPKGGNEAIRVLSPDGRLMALADDKKVHVFETSTGKKQCQIDSAIDRARRIIFTPDSSRLVIVDDKIRWCNATTGKVIASIDQKFNRGSSLALSADGLTLAVVGHGFLGGDFSVFRLDAATQKVIPQAKDAGLSGTASAAALSPDGRLIAVGKKLSGPVTIYDTATGRMIANHSSAHASPIAAMTFSADGLKLVTADVEGTIKIWEDVRKLTSKSAAVMTFKGHKGAITHVGLSATGKQLVSTGADKTARIWNMDHAGAAIRVLERVGVGCYAARFSPDGQWIAAAEGSSVRLWDAATGQLVRELAAADKGRVFSIAFSPTDHRLLAVGYGGQADVSHVTLWDIDTATELARLPGTTDLPDLKNDEYNGTVAALAFSPDGKYLVAGFGSPALLSPGSYPIPLKVWEVATRRLLRRLNGHTGFCVSLDFSRDGTRLASGSRDGTAILWSAESWKKVHTLKNPDIDKSSFRKGKPEMVEDVAFAPDGKTLAMASRDGSVLLWDVAGGDLLATLKGHSNAVGAVAFSPDGRTLATGAGDQTVRLWNIEMRRELMQLDAGNVDLGGVETLAFSPDGKHLLAGGRVGTAFWSTAPIVWNDPDRAAESLQWLRKSNADFPNRIRMLSENLRLHEALEKLDSKDLQVQAAVAASRANWYAAQHRWAEAAKEFDRLLKLSPDEPQSWLRTPGLIRVATALLNEGRTAQAAMLLTGGATRRTQDGLQPIVETVGLGFTHKKQPDATRITEIAPGSPAARSRMQVGDVLLKVDDLEVTEATSPKLADLLKGKAGTKVRLSVLHPRNDQTEDIDLVMEKYLPDPATGELWRPLLAAIDARLTKAPQDAGLLELRAELAGQWSDSKAQLADYTAAIEILARQKPEAAAGDLKRLYGRRGNAYVRLEKSAEAVADFARVITKETTDEEVLNNQAQALAAVLLRPKSQDAAMTFANPWAGLVTALWLDRDQQAIDRLVEGRPKFAEQIGDVFIRAGHWSRAAELYSRGITAKTTDAALLSKRARAYESLGNWEGAAADWSRAAAENPDAAALLGEFARRLAASDQAPLANSHFEKSLALYERSLDADPNNGLVAAELAQMLLNKYENGKATRWTPLNPMEMKSKGGATLTRLPDDSILAGGVNPDQDTYTIVAQTDLPKIRGIRLETLTHESLGHGGPGRAPWGNFALSGISLRAEPVADAGAPATLKLINPRTDFEQKGYPVVASLAGSPKTAWSIDPQAGRNHWAAYEIDPAQQDGFKEGTKLTFMLDFQFNNQHAIGRFRLSVSSDSATLEQEGKRFTVLSITDPWLQLGAAYAVNGRQDSASQYFGKALQREDGAEAQFTAPHGLGDLLGGALLDDATKAKMRGQVLGLLKAELSLRRKQLESDKGDERAVIHAALRAWQLDSNLAGLRDSAALAKLPSDETKALTQLWNDVAELSLQAITAAPADKQVDLIAEGLKERNPGFDGKLSHKVDAGVVTSVEVTSPLVQDLTPLRALTGLRSFTGRSTLGYDNKAESDAAFLRSIKTLEKINGKPVAQFWKEAEARQADFKKWLQKVSELPAEQQVAAVAAKLKERNPGFIGKLNPKIEGTVVTELGFEAKNVTDLSPVRALAGLKVLHCGGGPLSDLSPLKGMKLTSLEIAGCPVQDLEPLRGMPLSAINFHTCTRIQDLTPLKGMPLTYLNLHDGPKVADISPLKGMPLTDLWLGGNKMTDLSPLKGMPLTFLGLSHCRHLQDISQLKGLRLNKLLMDDTQVRDLEPLRGMPLSQIYIDTSRVTDLTPLRDIPLQDIRLTPKNITRGLDTLREMKSLNRIGLSHYISWPAPDFWTRYEKGEFQK